MHLGEDGQNGSAVVSSCDTAVCMANSPSIPPIWRTAESVSRFALSGGIETVTAEILLSWLLLPHRHVDLSQKDVQWRYGLNDAATSAVRDHRLSRDQLCLEECSSVFTAMKAIKSASLETLAPQEIPIDGQVLAVCDVEPPAEEICYKAMPSGPNPPSTFQLQAINQGQELCLQLRWSPPSLSSQEASSLLESFADILGSVLEDKNQDVAHVIGISRKDRAKVWAWNAALPPTLDRCMHDIIREQANAKPNDPAIESWNGSFTYSEVERLSNDLAHHLRGAGVSEGAVVPLLFEKSRWTIVAVLAVMKSGAAFSLTDPSQPEARLQTIVEQTGAKVIVASANNTALGGRIAPGCQILVPSAATIGHAGSGDGAAVSLPAVDAASPMYVIFTSGSTGRPKGVVISHANYTSGAIPRADAVGYRSHSRVFDFASYAFDVSIDCMLCTLACGGCLCIPTDEQRMNDLSGAIRDSKANMAHMTPSVARLLDPDVIPSLEVLGLGGEAVSAGDASDWSRHTNVVIAYGPSECTVGCTINNNIRESVNIGKGVGGLTWIVDPENHDILMPVGSVGELLIEGPVVGIGYLNEPEKTAQVFIDDPDWLLKGCGDYPGRRGRLYKTGDLVKYDQNGTGSIAFIGRKDQQVKLRGQRVELAEVEHHLRANLPAGVKVAAEVITPTGNEPTLVAFLSESNSPVDGIAVDTDVSLSIELSYALSRIEETLGSQVPRYMVPTAFIPLPEIPALVSGKVDRKRLREVGSSITREQISRLRVDTDRRGPQTEMEKALHKLWIQVLGISGDLCVGDSFFAMGGDSLRGMRLVAAAREQGISLSVATIFQHPTLKGMAASAEKIDASQQTTVPHFSLLGETWEPTTAQIEAAKLCDLEEASIEDVYPCTSLQEGLMALSAKVKEAYVAQRVVELADRDTAERFQSAFRIASEDCPILRTRIVQVPGQGLVQVVVRDPIQWQMGENLDSYLTEDRLKSMELGKPLVRCAIITESAKVHFVLTMHHALYDGWCMPLVVDRINKAYLGLPASKGPEFKDFIRYLKDINREESCTFWRDHLDGATGPQFPQLPWEGYQAQADSLLEHYVALPQRQAANTTVATVIRGAWALLASQYAASDDIVFGETLTGRNAPISGAEQIEGPMITTVPMRVCVDTETTVGEYLQEIHDQGVRQIAYEHVGLQHIRRLSPDALQACELRMGLVLHPSTDAEAEAAALENEDLPASRLVPAGDAEAAQEALKFNTYPLMLVCSLDPNGFLVMASFDSKCVGRAVMEKALEQLGHAARELCRDPERRLGGIELPVDAEQVREASVLCAAHLGKEFEGATAGWVVHREDPERLLPLGAVGELLIRTDAPLKLDAIAEPRWLQASAEQLVATGSTVEEHLSTNGDSVASGKSTALETLASAIESTSSAFTSPEATVSIKATSQLYRTGRLAKLGHDGNLTFVEKTVMTAVIPPVSQRRLDAKISTAKQRKLRSLWSRVLHLDEEAIGLNDSFFRLGGDSITAMKLVSEARLDGLRLTVVQIFQNRSLFEMAKIAQESETTTETPEKSDAAAPFALLEVSSNLEAVIAQATSQLADANWNITNVVPARPMQTIAVKGSTQLPRYSIRYEAMYFSGEIDRARLFKSCQDLVDLNEILRTVFVEVDDTCLGAIVEHVTVPVVEFEIDGGLEVFMHNLCAVDIHSKMPLGSSFVKFFFIQASRGESCLVFRLSHAQYDEICLPIFLHQLSTLYEGRAVQKALPFSSFVGHVVRENVPKSIPYWRDLLQGAKMSVLRREPRSNPTRHYAIQRSFDVSARSRDITVATLPTAAWALCLARRLGVRDVLFGEVVSGRNVDFRNCDAVAGPCWQYVPVRIRFEPGWTAADLLAAVQHQHVASSAFEGAGLEEIARGCGDGCVDWGRGEGGGGMGDLWFDTVVHQDVAHVEQLDFFATSSRMQTVYPHAEPLREWKLQAFAGGDEMAIEIVTVEGWRELAGELLEEVGEILDMLVRRPGDVLFEETGGQVGEA